jgi:acetoacetyl-CoA reductase
MGGELNGRVALVTGGTGGIGTAICTRLSDMGARVATTYRNREKAEDWQKRMKEQGHEVVIYACDVGDYDACVELIGRVEKELGPVDILVNNAGITRDTTLKKMTPQDWRDVICANLDSVFNMTQPVLAGMAQRGWGRVINISSINGQKGQFGQANYASSKAGIHGFTMSAAQEVARKGVTVNTVSPGYIATEMVIAVPEEVREKIVAQIPIGRLGRPEEVAHVVAFLASEDAGFITGANFAANGGQHMH